MHPTEFTPAEPSYEVGVTTDRGLENRRQRALLLRASEAWCAALEEAFANARAAREVETTSPLAFVIADVAERLAEHLSHNSVLDVPLLAEGNGSQWHRKEARDDLAVQLETDAPVVAIATLPEGRFA